MEDNDNPFIRPDEKRGSNSYLKFSSAKATSTSDIPDSWVKFEKPLSSSVSASSWSESPQIPSAGSSSSSIYSTTNPFRSRLVASAEHSPSTQSLPMLSTSHLKYIREGELNHPNISNRSMSCPSVTDSESDIPVGLSKSEFHSNPSINPFGDPFAEDPFSDANAIDPSFRPTLPPRRQNDFTVLPTSRARIISQQQMVEQHLLGTSPDGSRTHSLSYQSSSDSLIDEHPEPAQPKTKQYLYPDIIEVNRQLPTIPHSTSSNLIQHKGPVKLVVSAGDMVVTAQQCIRCWSLSSGDQVRTFPHFETKITSLCFVPSKILENEGKYIWVGLEQGELLAIDTTSCQKYASKLTHSGAVRFIYRYKGTIYTIDDRGLVYIWSQYDSNRLLTFEGSPAATIRIQPKSLYCIVAYAGEIWSCSGQEKTMEIATPSGTSKKVSFDGIFVGYLSSIGASCDESYVFTGHDDGTIVVWSARDKVKQCIYKITSYRVTSILSVFTSQLWVGLATGKVMAFDVSTLLTQCGGLDASVMTTGRWKMLKMWTTEAGCIYGLILDTKSLYHSGKLEVISYGESGVIQLWDGLLTNDWIDNQLRKKESEYCEYEELTVLLGSWNVDARKPKSLVLKDENKTFINDWMLGVTSPDIIVFGFQEIIDLESKKMNAKTFLKKNSASRVAEKQTKKCKVWEERLVRGVHDSHKERYFVLGHDNLVGLFSCIFVKEKFRERIRHVSIKTTKTGLGGLHGNKGAIASRFVLDDSSFCFVNCHLAAGQTNVVSRNNDAQTILSSTQFPALPKAASYKFLNGGDGLYPLDHEHFFLSGDLNYRIDLPRTKVIQHINDHDLNFLHQHDQLCSLRKSSPLHPLSLLSEGPLDFIPTYKYNRNTNVYDSSEKKRTPAWCDRILYRTSEREKVGLLSYRRLECDISDHRPISAGFSVQSKRVIQEKRHLIQSELERYFWTGAQQRKWTAHTRWLSSFGYGQIQCEQIYSLVGEDPTKALEKLEQGAY